MGFLGFLKFFMKIIQTFLFETDFLWTNKTLHLHFLQKIVRYALNEEYFRKK